MDMENSKGGVRNLDVARQIRARRDERGRGG